MLRFCTCALGLLCHHEKQLVIMKKFSNHYVLSEMWTVFQFDAAYRRICRDDIRRIKAL
jgi:hypothetical protein